MATEKQIRANRLNGLQGGVKTNAGKQKVRLNAVTHGILSKETLLPGEDRRLLDKLSADIMAELQPVGEMELILVERIVSSTWRLRRSIRNERKHYHKSLDYRSEGWQYSIRYEVALERQIFRARRELSEIQQARLSKQDPYT
jgi:hypothetical protein